MRQGYRHDRLYEQSNFILASIKLMEEQSVKLAILSDHNEGGSFVKGMSLEEYMSKKVVDCMQAPEDEIDTEENLYQSSGNHEMQGFMHRHIDYCINQIDEESVEDSNQSNLQQSFHIKERERPRNLVDIKNAVPVNEWKAKVSNISMNATAYFKNQRDDRNSFRVKRMSISPSKKQEKNLMNGSITIYGSKFGQVAQKKSLNMPQIVTFYGKLNSHQPQKVNDLASSKDKFKKKQIKHTPYRKNQLNLNQLLEYESRIKKNRASNTHLQQIKISRINRMNQKINY